MLCAVSYAILGLYFEVSNVTYAVVTRLVGEAYGLDLFG